MKRLLVLGALTVLPSAGAAQEPQIKCPGESTVEMRQVLKGHRIVRAQWVEKTNKESGAPDIGMKAEWEPITERR
jgi:hypothetical protein